MVRIQFPVEDIERDCRRSVSLVEYGHSAGHVGRPHAVRAHGDDTMVAPTQDGEVDICRVPDGEHGRIFCYEIAHRPHQVIRTHNVHRLVLEETVEEGDSVAEVVSTGHVGALSSINLDT